MLVFLSGLCLPVIRNGICFGYGVRQALKNDGVPPHPSDSPAKSSRCSNFSNLTSRGIFQYSAWKTQDIVGLIKSKIARILEHQDQFWKL